MSKKDSIEVKGERKVQLRLKALKKKLVDSVVDNLPHASMPIKVEAESMTPEVSGELVKSTFITKSKRRGGKVWLKMGQDTPYAPLIHDYNESGDYNVRDAYTGRKPQQQNPDAKDEWFRKAIKNKKDEVEEKLAKELRKELKGAL